MVCRTRLPSVDFEPARRADASVRFVRTSSVLPSVAATIETRRRDALTWKWRVNGGGSGLAPPNMGRWGHRLATPMELTSLQIFYFLHYLSNIPARYSAILNLKSIVKFQNCKRMLVLKLGKNCCRNFTTTTDLYLN